MALAGEAVWSGNPGLPVVEATYTCGHGVTPGVATITTPYIEKALVGLAGNLTFRDGVHPACTVRDCRVSQVIDTDLPSGARGLTIVMQDGRWKWKYGSVTGNYNVIDPHPDPDTLPAGPGVAFNVRGGIHVPGTARTPQQLIKACFDLVGQRVEFEGVPSEERPPVDWEGDNPARAADRVADAVGCRLIYRPIDGVVWVRPPGGQVKLGRGLVVISEQPEYDGGDRPTHLELIGGHTLVTDLVKLRAVGWEEDGRLVPIEKLSYMPADGWWNFSPDYEGWWQAIRRGDCSSLNVARALARQFVWKLFRVEAVPVDRPLKGEKPRDPNARFDPPVFGKIRNRRQILVSDRMVFPDRDASGQYKTKPAAALSNGVDWSKERGGLMRNMEPFGDPKVPFAVAADSGLVTFQRPMYRVRSKTGSGLDQGNYDPLYGPTTPGRIQYQLPDIYLECAMRARDARTWQVNAGRWERRIGADPALRAARMLESHRRPDLQLVYRVRRQLVGLKRTALESNERDVNRRALAVLASLAVPHAGGKRLARTFAGLIPVQPDGAIQSVTWSCGVGQPPTTRVGFNTETEAHLPTFEERRTNERKLDWLTRDWIREVLDLGPFD